MSVGDSVPSAVAIAGSSIYFSSLETLYRVEIENGIRTIAHVGDHVNDHTLAVGPDDQLFCGVGESVVGVDKTGRFTTLARCSGPVRAIAVGDDGVVFVDDNAILERRESGPLLSFRKMSLRRIAPVVAGRAIACRGSTNCQRHPTSRAVGVWSSA